jgi:catechol 2,3-dioxygenase-like lactoylglutathione lyase family enzyme
MLAGFDHVAVLTADLERFVAFYDEVFGAEIEGRLDDGGVQMVVLRIGPSSEINVFQIDGNAEAEQQTPIFERGRLDHFGFRARSLDQFEQIRDELIRRGCSDGFVTDFGHVLSVFFRDPEGLELEVCVANPDAVPGRINPPGTPSARYHGGHRD